MVVIKNSPNNDYNIINVMTGIHNNYYLIFFIVFKIVYNYKLSTSSSRLTVSTKQFYTSIVLEVADRSGPLRPTEELRIPTAHDYTK